MSEAAVMQREQDLCTGCGRVMNPGNGNGKSHSSESIGKLVEALAKAQLEFKPIVKSVENLFYSTDKKKAMYADLSAIIAATQPSLAKNGLTVIQLPLIHAETKEAGVRSVLAHASGEWIENEILLPATAKVKVYKDGTPGFTWGEKFDAQTCGIAITYSRRYSYGSLTGVAAEEDDDGNSIGEAGAQGSKEAAQAVAARKIAEAKERQAVLPPQAEIPVNGEVIGANNRYVLGGRLREYLSKTTTGKAHLQYWLVMVDNEELRMWGNPKFGDKQDTTFEQLLTFGHGRFAQFVVEDQVTSKGTFKIIKGVKEIAGRRWEDDGTEIIERQPGE